MDVLAAAVKVLVKRREKAAKKSKKRIAEQKKDLKKGEKKLKKAKKELKSWKQFAEVLSEGVDLDGDKVRRFLYWPPKKWPAPDTD